MNLVIRLDSEPLRISGEGAGASEISIKGSVVGGSRSGAYLKDTSTSGATVGVMLRAGAAGALFGVPASELAETHTALAHLWGAEASSLEDRIASRSTLSDRIDCLEAFLLERISVDHGLHPGIARVIEEAKWRRADSISASGLARDAGLGPRRFAQLFRETVGVTPKRWLRVQRFQDVLRRASEDGPIDWADLALSLGYSDQPHLVREFRSFSGLTPSEYRRLAPVSPSHVPLLDESPISSRRTEARLRISRST